MVDLFCGPGGASCGYHRAGFEVVGVDSTFQINYPYRFIKWDALKVNTTRFDVIAASPPCQRYSKTRHLTSQHPARHRKDHPDLVEPTRELLKATGKPYIIENVEGAPLIDPVLVCGAAFNLGALCKDGVYRHLRRHRLFESNVPLVGTGCHCKPGVPIIGVYGHGSAGSKAVRGYQGTVTEREQALDVDWARSTEMSQMVPPAYCQFLGKQLLEAIS
jgi:DNA (cytosine-5)-methyltransferase 1